VKFRFRCRYCGHQFIEYYYSAEGAEGAKCPKCNDKHLDVIEEKDGDVYGYHKE